MGGPGQRPGRLTNSQAAQSGRTFSEPRCGHPARGAGAGLGWARQQRGAGVSAGPPGQQSRHFVQGLQQNGPFCRDASTDRVCFRASLSGSSIVFPQHSTAPETQTVLHGRIRRRGTGQRWLARGEKKKRRPFWLCAPPPPRHSERNFGRLLNRVWACMVASQRRCADCRRRSRSTGMHAFHKPVRCVDGLGSRNQPKTPQRCPWPRWTVAGRRWALW